MSRIDDMIKEGTYILDFAASSGFARIYFAFHRPAIAAASTRSRRHPRGQDIPRGVDIRVLLMPAGDAFKMAACGITRRDRNG